jgi:hypothetical protein
MAQRLPPSATTGDVDGDGIMEDAPPPEYSGIAATKPAPATPTLRQSSDARDGAIGPDRSDIGDKAAPYSLFAEQSGGDTSAALAPIKVLATQGQNETGSISLPSLATLVASTSGSDGGGTSTYGVASDASTSPLPASAPAPVATAPRQWINANPLSQFYEDSGRPAVEENRGRMSRHSTRSNSRSAGRVIVEDPDVLLAAQALESLQSSEWIHTMRLL